MIPTLPSLIITGTHPKEEASVSISTPAVINAAPQTTIEKAPECPLNDQSTSLQPVSDDDAILLHWLRYCKRPL